MALVQQDRDKFACFLTEYQHKTVESGKVEFDVVIETRGDLDYKIFITGNSTILDVYVSGWIFEKELSPTGGTIVFP
jgi:hypothetical protein